MSLRSTFYCTVNPLQRSPTWAMTERFLLLWIRTFMTISVLGRDAGLVSSLGTELVHQLL